MPSAHQDTIILPVGSVTGDLDATVASFQAYQAAEAELIAAEKYLKEVSHQVGG